MIQNAVIILIILLIIDMVCLVFLHKSNKALKKEIQDIKKWCNEVIDNLVNKESDIDNKLNILIDNIKNGKVSNKVTELRDYEGKCPFHEEVYNTMQKEHDDMIDEIKSIKEEKDDMIKNIMENQDKFNL